MSIRRVPIDPGTPGAAVYWPFKVFSLGGDWVSVNKGELFYDPLIGGELVDIKGIGMPFRVNEDSMIYLQVFFDMVGRVTHCGIAHTGKHLPWLLRGERWLGYPRMYAVQDLPFFGLQAFNQAGMTSSTAGFYPLQVHSDARMQATGRVPAQPYVLANEGWFSEARRDGEGWSKTGGQANHGVNPDYTMGDKDFGMDEETTVAVNAGAKQFVDKQIYTGIDRELRKDICAQGLNVANPRRNEWPYNLKDVGRYPMVGTNPPMGLRDYSWRRQKMGGWDKSTVPWTPVGRGKNEIGGYMNVGVGLTSGPGIPPEGRALHAEGEKQRLSYTKTHAKIQKGWGRDTIKLHKTNMDQVMAVYPIAYATRPTRKMETGFIQGVNVGAQEFGPYTGRNGGKPYKTKEFQIYQACKSQLRLATVLDGDSRYKAIVPYQGMHSDVMVYEGDITADWLNFRQAWEFHAGGWNLGTGTSAGGDWRYVGPPWFAYRGSKYYRRETGHDLPFNQNYLDALFNNQKPD